MTTAIIPLEAFRYPYLHARCLSRPDFLGQRITSVPEAVESGGRSPPTSWSAWQRLRPVDDLAPAPGGEQWFEGVQPFATEAGTYLSPMLRQNTPVTKHPIRRTNQPFPDRARQSEHLDIIHIYDIV